jgi:hypothetical protein
VEELKVVWWESGDGKVEVVAVLMERKVVGDMCGSMVGLRYGKKNPTVRIETSNA